MFKLLCLFAVLIVVAAGLPQYEIPAGYPQQPPVPMRRMMKREAPAPALAEPSPNQANGNEPMNAAEGQDDMDKAETFGFGYHHYYAYPRYYYPSYHYGYYPRYHYGYYW